MNVRIIKEQELDFIRKNASSLTPTQIAVKLFMSIHLVKKVMLGENIEACSKRKARQLALLPDQEDFIKVNAKTMSVTKIAARIGSTWNIVYRYMQNNNISCKERIEIRYDSQDNDEIIPDEKKKIERPPAVYSNPDWSKKYLD